MTVDATGGAGELSARLSPCALPLFLFSLQKMEAEYAGVEAAVYIPSHAIFTYRLPHYWHSHTPLGPTVHRPARHWWACPAAPPLGMRNLQSGGRGRIFPTNLSSFDPPFRPTLDWSGVAWLLTLSLSPTPTFYIDLRVYQKRLHFLIF